MGREGDVEEPTGRSQGDGEGEEVEEETEEWLMSSSRLCQGREAEETQQHKQQHLFYIDNILRDVTFLLR